MVLAAPQFNGFGLTLYSQGDGVDARPFDSPQSLGKNRSLGLWLNLSDGLAGHRFLASFAAMSILRHQRNDGSLEGAYIGF
jgi:hypothetical protein